MKFLKSLRKFDPLDQIFGCANPQGFSKALGMVGYDVKSL